VIFFELLIIVGKHPSVWEKVILIWKPLFERHETVTKVVLS